MEVSPTFRIVASAYHGDQYLRLHLIMISVGKLMVPAGRSNVERGTMP
jgi:hypothetical protein